MTTLPAGAARPVAPAAAPSERAVLVAVALGAMLMPLNSTMVAVALPDVGHSFHDGIAAVSWLVTSYLIAMAALQPVAGKLGDRLGRRPLVLGGLWAFGVASVIAPAAPSLAVLIVLRVAQAAAGALVFPNAMALLRELLPEHRRAAGFGMFGAAIGIAAAAGPPIGGLLVGLFGWQGIFAVNVPMVAAALVLGRRALVARPRPAGVSAPFDALGAGLLCVVLADVALLLNPGAIGSGGRAAAAVALLPLLVLFARRELGHPDPVLQPRLLRRVPFAAATAGVGLSNLALYATLLAVPVLLDRRGGWSSEEIGLVLTAMSGSLVVASPLGGRIADRRGRRFAAVLGLWVLSAGMVPLALAGGTIGAGLLVATLVPVGFGLGLANAALQTAAVEALEERDAGIASGVFSTGRYLGSITSAGVLAAAVGHRGSHGFAAVFAVALAAAVASALLSVLLPAAQARRSARV